MTTPTITLDRFTLTPEVDRYTNGRLAISFFDEEGPFSKLTVNLPDVHLNEGEFLVKHWAENAPLVQALLDAGWITPTGREVSSGYVFPMVARAAGPLKEFLDNAPDVR